MEESRVTGTGLRTAPRLALRIGHEGAEMLCRGCREWYAVTLEFWPGERKYWRCRACERERSRLYQARKRFDPAFRLRDINKSRRYRAYIAGRMPELIDAIARESRLREEDRLRLARRERNRKWMRAYRARLRAAEGRERYERRAAA